jgi:hypothetical protein
MSDFAAAVQRMRAAMAGDDPWDMAVPVPGEPSAELQSRRRAGREAYESSLRRRGVSGQTARIFASCLPIFEGVED